MGIQWFPCRWCGEEPVVGIDMYVLCAECLVELAARKVVVIPPEESVQKMLSPAEQASVRRLLDW